MKPFLPLIAGILRSIADSLEKKQNDASCFDIREEVEVMPDVDFMADVDDQRAHHFGGPKGLDDSV